VTFRESLHYFPSGGIDPTDGIAGSPPVAFSSVFASGVLGNSNAHAGSWRFLTTFPFTGSAPLSVSLNFESAGILCSPFLKSAVIDGSHAPFCSAVLSLSVSHLVSALISPSAVFSSTELIITNVLRFSGTFHASSNAAVSDLLWISAPFSSDAFRESLRFDLSLVFGFSSVFSTGFFGASAVRGLTFAWAGSHPYEASAVVVRSAVLPASRLVSASGHLAGSWLQHSPIFERSPGLCLSDMMRASASFHASGPLFVFTLSLRASHVLLSSNSVCGSAGVGHSAGLNVSGVFMCSNVLSGTSVPAASHDDWATKRFEFSALILGSNPHILSVLPEGSATLAVSLTFAPTAVLAASVPLLPTAPASGSSVFVVTAFGGSEAHEATSVSALSVAFRHTAAVPNSVLFLVTDEPAVSLSPPPTLHFLESAAPVSARLAASSSFPATAHLGFSSAVGATTALADSHELAWTFAHQISEALRRTAAVAPSGGVSWSAAVCLSSAVSGTADVPSSVAFRDTGGFVGSFAAAETKAANATEALRRSGKFGPSGRHPFSAAGIVSAAFATSACFAESFRNATYTFSPSDPLTGSDSLSATAPLPASGAVPDSSLANLTAALMASGRFNLSSAAGSVLFADSTAIGGSRSADSERLDLTPPAGVSAVASGTSFPDQSDDFLLSVSFVPSGMGESAIPCDSSVPGGSHARRATPEFPGSPDAALTEGLLESGFFSLSVSPGTVELGPSLPPELSHAAAPSLELAGSEVQKESLALADSGGAVETAGSFESRALSGSRSFSTAELAVSPACEPSAQLLVSSFSARSDAAIASAAFVPEHSTVPGRSAGQGRSFPGNFAESSALGPTRSLFPQPATGDQAGTGTRTPVGGAWVTVIAAILAFLVIALLACGVIVWRRLDPSTIPTDDLAPEAVSTEYAATGMELDMISDYDIERELECENPMLSDSDLMLQFSGENSSSDFDALSCAHLDEGVVLL
jgi:hypothetical protein